MRRQIGRITLLLLWNRHFSGKMPHPIRNSKSGQKAATMQSSSAAHKPTIIQTFLESSATGKCLILNGVDTRCGAHPKRSQCPDRKRLYIPSWEFSIWLLMRLRGMWRGKTRVGECQCWAEIKWRFLSHPLTNFWSPSFAVLLWSISGTMAENKGTWEAGILS